MKQEIYEQLKKEAVYALNSKSIQLVCEAYGAAEMARQLEAITKDQFYELNDMLVRNGLNNPSAGIR